ncbi:MAG: T9SS type A sorting domain-containing protein [Bacteroidota bacterium]
MKTRNRFGFPLACFIIFGTTGAFPQQMTDLDNQWNIYFPPTFSANSGSISVRVQEDTVIDGLTYQVLYASNDSLNTSWIPRNQYLRQDSNQRVFLKDGENVEQLLYDFSLAANDTFYVENLQCSLVVNEVDSVTLNNGALRKRLKLGKADSPAIENVAIWIEGMGNTSGIFSHIDYCALDIPQHLLCFYSNGELLYPSNPASCFITSLRTVEEVDIEIFPNPADHILWIEYSRINMSNYFIFNIKGEQIKEGVIERTGVNIHLEDLASGAYFLVLMDAQGRRYSKKILKN